MGLGIGGEDAGGRERVVGGVRNGDNNSGEDLDDGSTAQIRMREKALGFCLRGSQQSRCLESDLQIHWALVSGEGTSRR